MLGFAHSETASPKAMVLLEEYVLLNGVLPLDEIQKLLAAQFANSVEICCEL